MSLKWVQLVKFNLSLILGEARITGEGSTWPHAKDEKSTGKV